MEIIKKLIQYNFTSDANTPVYIVIHDTGNGSRGANADMHYRYFNSEDRQASAHFFIDDTQILQVVEIKDKAWHCGDGANRFGINNANSIGIEMCINADGNYSVMLSKTLELVLYLMQTYNIDIAHVVRHYDASRKNCPQTMNINGKWLKWDNFKQSIANSIKVFPQWQLDAVQYLKDHNFILSDHRPDEIITFKVFAAIFNNVTLRQTNINSIDWLLKYGYIKGMHNESELITLETFAYIMVNVLKDTLTVKPLVYLYNKGFLKEPRTNPQEYLTMCLFGAMMKNAESVGLKLF